MTGRAQAGRGRVERKRDREWLDVTVPLREGLVEWPGDPSVRIGHPQAMTRGDDCNVSSVSLCSHTGTHVDAPLHYLAQGSSLDQLSFEASMGRARVIALRGRRAVGAEELRRHRLRAGERVLLRTANSAFPWADRPFHEEFVYLSVEAARHLAERGVRTVGIDYLSVGGFQDPAQGAEVHRILLAAGILVIEGLDLREVRPGPYQLVCLPLRIAGGDGAPARVVLKRLRR